MKRKDKIKKRINNYLYDHIFVKTTLGYTFGAFIATLAALTYALAFVCFIAPANVIVENSNVFASLSVITGGAGGISQVIHLIFKLCGQDFDIKTMQSIFYFVLNIPLVIFAFFKIGKRFVIMTGLNVGLSSLFVYVLGQWQFTEAVAEVLSGPGMHIVRVIFGGALVGLSSAIAFKGNISCGGIDVVSYYFAERKSTSVGKYTTTLNAFIALSYTILTCVINKGVNNEIPVLNMLFSAIYLMVTFFVLDSINTRNRKSQLQIITENASMSSILIANFPHATTTVAGEGGYSHHKKQIVYLVCSSSEINKIIKTIKKVDEHAFVTVTHLIQAYGNFYIKPIE